MMTWIALRNVSTLTRVNEAATFPVYRHYGWPNDLNPSTSAGRAERLVRRDGGGVPVSARWQVAGGRHQLIGHRRIGTACVVFGLCRQHLPIAPHLWGSVAWHSRFFDLSPLAADPTKPEAMCMRMRMPCSALLGFIVTAELQVRAHLLMAVLPGLVRACWPQKTGRETDLLWLWF